MYDYIIDFIADCFKAIVRQYKLDIKVKTGDVGVRTGTNSSRIPDIAVIDGRVYSSYRRDKSAVIEDGLMLAVEVVLKDTASHISPGVEQIERDYTDKAMPLCVAVRQSVPKGIRASHIGGVPPLEGTVEPFRVSVIDG